MAFQRLLCGLTVAVLLFTEGCHSQYKDCGMSSFNGSIMGMSNASAGSWPWQASLQRNGSHFCGATLFHEEWVMTAAHCMEGNQSQMVKAVLGSLSLSKASLGQVMRNVTMVKCFPLYNNKTREDDICLLKLSKPVNSTDYVSPVCLPTKNSTFPSGQHSWVSGWFGHYNGTSAHTLQQMPLKIVGNKPCQCAYDKNITKYMMCAGVKMGGKYLCQGDSGNPLVVNGSRWIQGGVMSFSDGCVKPGMPGVFTRVAQYQMWISNVTGMSMSDFVEFMSPVMNNHTDANFSCANYTTPAPHHNMTTTPYMTTTHYKTTTHNMTTTHHMTTTTPYMTTTTKDDDKDCNDFFCSAANVVHISSVGFIVTLSLLLIGVA